MYLDNAVKLFYLRTRMPRVVIDQRGKFDTDELFANLSRPAEVKYIDFPSGSDEERRHKFLQDCADGRVDIAFSSSGFNLELHISRPPTGVDESAANLPVDKVDMDSEPPKVHIRSHFILNGVCVRWTGFIDRHTLKGIGCIEFDERRAALEDQRLQREWAALEERFRPAPPSTTNGGEASSSTSHSSVSSNFNSSRPGTS